MLNGPPSRTLTLQPTTSAIEQRSTSARGLHTTGYAEFRITGSVGGQRNEADRKTAKRASGLPNQVKVRDHGRVVSKATVVAYAVHESGIREVIGLDVGEVESGAFWVEFLRGLKQRGLDGVRLAISDQHEGLKAAIARVLACPWQRCTVHF